MIISIYYFESEENFNKLNHVLGELIEKYNLHDLGIDIQLLPGKYYDSYFSNTPKT